MSDGMSDERAARLAARLAGHEPADEREAASVERILAALERLDAPFDRHAAPTHVTAAGIVLDGAGHVLLHRHLRLDRWLQPGGHLEGDETPAGAAVRETREETGLAVDAFAGPAELVHVDVHDGLDGHVHLDLRHLLHAPGRPAPVPPAGESQQVAWLSHEEAGRRTDAACAAAIRAAARRLSGRHAGRP